jgi:hypothetical protein
MFTLFEKIINFIFKKIEIKINGCEIDCESALKYYHFYGSILSKWS